MISVLFLGALHVAAASDPAVCTLHRADGQWRGTCPALVEGADATITLAPAAAITTGAWRRDAKPSAVWSGTLAAPEVPATPVELEAYADGAGVMRTVFGWFATKRLTTADDSMRIELDTTREAAPSAVDRGIVERAARILSADASWNRADDRKCPDAATTWSIYCAMQKATMEVAGAFHHRRPALQVVRTIVDERTAGRPYDHRLMDYNNDPTTTLADVQSLFAEALRRIDAQAGNVKTPAQPH